MCEGRLRVVILYLPMKTLCGNMKTFEDLDFVPESGSLLTYRAVMRFPNGYGVSVLTGGGVLCDSERPYELAVVKFRVDNTFELIYPSLFDNDVIPFLTAEGVSSYMRIIQVLPELF